jgi:dimethylaniline monooxygenase (N-oxide forming)
VDYLKAYASKFKLLERILLGRKVINVRWGEGGRHIVSYLSRKTDHPDEWQEGENWTVLTPECYLHASSDTETIEAYYVGVCTGLHVIPSVPDIPGIEHVTEKYGESAVYHSSQYKRRDELAGKRIMILGTGETGMDLAYEAAKAQAKEVVLCSKSGYEYVNPQCLHFTKELQILVLPQSARKLITYFQTLPCIMASFTE